MFPKTKKFKSLIAALSAFAVATPFGAVAAPPLDLSAYKGKVVYLDFWASWCQPCKESFPYMEQLKQLYGNQGLVIIAVNVDHSESRAQAFLQAMNSDLQVAYDPKGELASKFKVRDMPTSVLIGRDGTTRYIHNGFYTDQTATYGSQVAELIHEH